MLIKLCPESLEHWDVGRVDLRLDLRLLLALASITTSFDTCHYIGVSFCFRMKRRMKCVENLRKETPGGSSWLSCTSFVWAKELLPFKLQPPFLRLQRCGR